MLGKRAIIDAPTAVIGLLALAILTRTSKIPEPVLILAAGAIGLALRGRQ